MTVHQTAMEEMVVGYNKADLADFEFPQEWRHFENDKDREGLCKLSVL